jgi:hypothetical protein
MKAPRTVDRDETLYDLMCLLYPDEVERAQAAVRLAVRTYVPEPTASREPQFSPAAARLRARSRDHDHHHGFYAATSSGAMAEETSEEDEDKEDERDEDEEDEDDEEEEASSCEWDWVKDRADLLLLREPPRT